MDNTVTNEQEQISICSICGKPIIPKSKNRMTVDHIYPQEFWKWSHNKQLKTAILSQENRAPAHEKCNIRKDGCMPSIKRLYIPEDQKKALVIKMKPLISEMQNVRDMKMKVAKKQGFKCYNCGRPVGKRMTLRRIDHDKPRDWSNACVVCCRCNAIHGKTAKKNAGTGTMQQQNVTECA